MKKFAFALLAMATALAITPSAMADSIGVTSVNGDVKFSATGITVASPSTGIIEKGNGSTTGMFAGLAGDTVTLAPFKFNSTADGVEAWDDIGANVSFTISTLTLDYAVAGLGFLVNGTGVIDDKGDLIDVSYVAEGGKSGTSFSYGINASTPPIPEPSSLLLLGTGLLGLAFVAFRKAKPARPVLHLSL
jgi:hypothetical protein